MEFEGIQSCLRMTPQQNKVRKLSITRFPMFLSPIQQSCCTTILNYVGFYNINVVVAEYFFAFCFGILPLQVL